MPSIPTAQVCLPPPLTSANARAGGLLWPLAFAPQQAIRPSVAIAQLWLAPAPTNTKVPLGVPEIGWPQQSRVPVVRTAHVCDPFALSCQNLPAGAVLCPRSFLPQQAMVLSMRSAHVW
jgi:hypothetical protein